MKTYICTKLRLYSYLTTKGFMPYRVQPDKFNAKRLVWLYEACDELRDAIEEYYSMVPKNKLK